MEVLDAAFAKLTRGGAIALFKSADMPCESANEPQDIYEDPQCWENDILCKYPYPGGERNFATNPIRFASLSVSKYFTGGMQGEATEEIMTRLGYTREQIKTAIESGAVEGRKKLAPL